MPQPFPLKATDHCYGASGRLLMGLGCKLIGHRKAQNIQWCSAFIPSWTGPCWRAKRWLISTLKLAWTVVSTVRRVRGVVKGPWDNILSTLTPFYQTSFLELLQNAKDLYQECLRYNTQIQVNDSNQKIQSLYFFCPINMNLKVSLRTWNRWMCEELHVKQMKTMNYEQLLFRHVFLYS